MERRRALGHRATRLLFALLLVPSTAAVAMATQIVVSTTADDTATNGNCTLREAFLAANGNVTRDACPAGSNAGTDEIVLATDATYSLTIAGSSSDGSLGTLVVANNGAATDVKITVTGGGTATIAQDAVPDTAILAVSVGARLDMQDVVLEGGSASNKGGAIFVAKSALLSLLRCTLRDNSAASNGGAIFNAGTLVADGCSFLRNVSSAGGGAIGTASETTTLVTNSLFVENVQLNKFDGGGAIASSASLSVQDSAFVNNRARGIGAALSHFDDVVGQSSIAGNCFIGNEADVSEHAVDVFAGSAVLNAGNDWWGASDGPGGAGPGHGDAIGTLIDASAPAATPSSACLPLELIANGNFQNDSDGDRVPQRWAANRVNTPVEGVVCAANGACNVKLRGNGTPKSLLQSVRLGGHAGDSFTFKARSRAKAVPTGVGQYRAQASVFYTDGTQQDFDLTFDAGTHAFQRRSLTINPSKDYGKIRVRIEYGRASGVVRFTGLSLVMNP